MRCEICGANDGRLHRVREMMFGMGDEFRYHECQNEFQFWGSDLYRAGKPLQGTGPPPQAVLTQLRDRAEALNKVQDGDSGQFYLS
jgi:hypothetical protein